MEKKSIFDYMQQYWDWADANKDKSSPGTCAVYFFILRVANSLRWKTSFGLTSKEVMEGINIGSYNTYRKYFDILVESGLLKIDKPSTNQYNCNIIALSNFDNAMTNALSNFDRPTIDALSNFDRPHEKHVKHSKESKDIVDNYPIKEEGGAPKFGTRPLAWFKTSDKQTFIKKVEPFRQQYPDQFLRDFVNYYAQEHQDGDMLLNHQIKFDIETKLRQWWSDPKTKDKYAQKQYKKL